MASSSKRKLTTKTYKEKYDIIRFCEENKGMKTSAIAEKFKIPRPTLYDVLKNKSKIIDAIEKGESVETKSGTVKRIKQVSFEDVDCALLKWFRQCSDRPEIRIDSVMLLLKARSFAKDLGYEDVEQITAPWIERFRSRYDIGRVLKAGESGGVDVSIVEAWKSGKLMDILKRYEPVDIYNADETGLFYLLLPENTLGFKGQTYHGTKESKVRITLLLAANMDGSDKLPVFCIGKSKKPRAFKHVRSLPVPYSANKKAWMTSELFDQWMRKLDLQMRRNGRKICMVIDNCTAHPAYTYENVELVFLPPRTTSHTQPMDAGVIKNFKFHYRRLLATRRLDAVETKAPFKWDLLDTLFAIRTAWGLVKQTTVQNCFRKTGFVAQTDEEVEDQGLDEEVAADQFRNIWDRLRDTFGDLPSFDDYVVADDNENVTEDLTDAEIIASVKSTSDADANSSEEEIETAADDVDIVAVKPPTSSEAFKAIDILRRFAASSDNCPATIIDSIDKYENFIQDEMRKKMRQTTMDDFLEKM